MLALLEEGDGPDGRDDDDDDDDGPSEGVEGGRRKAEWVEVMKKHRILAGKLELMASGVGGRGLPDRGSQLAH
jgi:hypothetical protein